MALRSISRPTLIKLGVAATIILGVAIAKERIVLSRAEAVRNYEVKYRAPEGWKAIPHGPQTLFLYQEPGSGYKIHGAVNQMFADINPTADMDSNRLAESIVRNTQNNMPDWKAELLERIPTETVDFRVVRRERVDRRSVVTAFAVKGNTTFMVSLCSDKRPYDEISKKMEVLREYVKGIRLEPIPDGSDHIPSTNDSTQMVTR